MTSAAVTDVAPTSQGGHVTKQCQNPISCRHLSEFLFIGLLERRTTKLKARALLTCSAWHFLTDFFYKNCTFHNLSQSLSELSPGHDIEEELDNGSGGEAGVAGDEGLLVSLQPQCVVPQSDAVLVLK